jgi:hypothetical protein
MCLGNTPYKSIHGGIIGTERTVPVMNRSNPIQSNPIQSNSIQSNSIPEKHAECRNRKGTVEYIYGKNFRYYFPNNEAGVYVSG